MPVTVTGTVTQESIFIPGRVTDSGGLSIDVQSFFFNIDGTIGEFAGALNQSITDNATNYVYIASGGALTINTTGFPGTGDHVRLAIVTTSGGVITNIEDRRAFLTANTSGGGGGTDQVKVSSDDTTAGFLNGKLTAGSGITLTENNPGGNENLSVVVTDQNKIDLITTGLCRIIYPTDAGIKSPSTAVDAATNNNMAALKFITAQDGQMRWVARPPQNRTSGDVIMRLYCSIIATQGGSRNTDWEWGYNFKNSGVDLGSYTIKTAVQSMNALVVDQIFTIDLTMPAADFSAASDLMFMRVARMGATGPNDNFGNNVYVHALELRYTGWRFAGQPGM